MNEIDNQRVIQLLKEIAARGTCRKRKVGAFLLQSMHVIIKASNGMPEGSARSCLDGGCARCANNEPYPHGLGYDLCFCLHAEERVLAMAARRGVSVVGSLLFSSYQPCIMCLKMIIESGIRGVRYVEKWEVPEIESGVAGLKAQYEAMSEMLPEGNQSIVDKIISSSPAVEPQ